MIYPSNVKNNKVIALIASSAGIKKKKDKRRLDLAIKNINNLGYKTKYNKNILENKKFVSGSGASRAFEFMKYWSDDKIDVISQIRGGELLLEMIPYIDSKIILNHSPKWLFGYSDSSLLNFYITTNYNIATINSSNILHFSMDNIHKSLYSIIDCISKDKIIQNSFKYYEKKKKHCNNYNLDSLVKYKSLYKEKEIIIKGRIIGGCLEAISEIVGTKYDNVRNFCSSFKEGMIWYLDIFDSNPLDLYRKLWQLKEAGWFLNINGILIGRTRSKKRIGDFTYLDSFHKIFDDMNIPVIYDVDIGHVMPQFAIINGSFATFTYKNGKGNIIQEKK